ncbi:hypothetical protein BBO_02032 [Beauveria brongniartii RCEF 3172]|uniref:Uncharacterized protein n=1 Tax=Beauveria brongniartii RCEF 3172 TaxID=1081107 RepID=A0A167IEK8_9HYPO|nr:hypothetical protein BBO_02032 [Beauveria brongniartii RCEF 3172]
MPRFQSRREAPAEPAAAEAALKKPGLFHSRREPSPARTTSTTTSSSRDVRSNRGSFLRRSHDDGAVAVAEQEDTPQRSPSLLHKGLYKMGMGGGDRDLDDPSILRAREHVMGAEAAEEEADRALDAARRRVREAREHVRRLKEEAEADARRARIKQHHAAEVSKRGKVLGRHGL